MQTSEVKKLFANCWGDQKFFGFVDESIKISVFLCVAAQSIFAK